MLSRIKTYIQGNKKNYEPRITCVLLTCNSDIGKGSSVFHSISSVFNQTLDYFELVLIENGDSKKVSINKLKDFCNQLNQRRQHKIKITLVKKNKRLNWGEARNLGVSKSSGDILVFLDDDTIITDKQAFRKISQLSEKYDFGFGAKRLWTKDDWFQEESNSILGNILKGNYTDLVNNSGDPMLNIRGVNDIALQKVTFIANFGFCRKEVFEKVGGFPNYMGYGFEDDYLMFLLYEAGYKYVLLNSISVVHVNHKIVLNQYRSLIPHFQNLVKRGYYWFHVSKLFKKKPVPKSEVLELLKSIHYDYKIEEAYEYYKRLVPLDIKSKNDGKYKVWVKVNQYSIQAFAQQVYLLQRSHDLNDYIQKSKGDFDNVALIVDSAVTSGLIEIDSHGVINNTYVFRFTQPNILESIPKISIQPNSEFNQFPCDLESRIRRYNLIKQRFPFAEYLRFGIIGDDDLLSLQFKNDIWAWPVVIELDEKITSQINKYDERIQIIKQDVRELRGSQTANLATFITDPPYTLHGALVFIYTGLSMLHRDWEEKEFYVIMNETMMGKSLSKLQEYLAQSGVFLTEVHENFSHYVLPKTFSERRRAEKFAQKLGLKNSAINFSSSSNLYIFKTINPNLNILKKHIDVGKIYEHY